MRHKTISKPCKSYPHALNRLQTVPVVALLVLLLVGSIVAEAVTTPVDGFVVTANYLSKYITAAEYEVTSQSGSTGPASTGSCTWSGNTFTITAKAGGGMSGGSRTGAAELTLKITQAGELSFEYSFTANNGSGTITGLGIDKTFNTNLTSSEAQTNGSKGSVSIKASNSNGSFWTSTYSESTLTVSDLKFKPYFTVVLQEPEGTGHYTCTVNGTESIVTDTAVTLAPYPGPTISATSTDVTKDSTGTTDATSYVLSAKEVAGWTFDRWEVSYDGGVTYTTISENADFTYTPGYEANSTDISIRPVYLQNMIVTTFPVKEGGTYTATGTEKTVTIDSTFGSQSIEQPISDTYSLTATANAATETTPVYYVTGWSVTDTIVSIAPVAAGTPVTKEGIEVKVKGEVFPIFTPGVTVTLKAPSEGIASYTVTASLNGKTVTLPFTDPITTEQTITVPEGTTLTLSSVNLTNEDQYNFSCWTIGDNLLSVETEAAATIQESGIEIGPLAVSSKAIYEVEGAQYSTWELAMEAAEVSTTKVAILLTNEELPTTMQENGLPDNGGDYVKPDGNGGIKYIIPDGVYLLLPHTAGDKEIGVDTITNGTTSTLKYANRKFTTDTTGMFSTTHGLNVTLTVPISATVEVSGVLTIGGTIYSISGESIAGAPAGAHSNIQLNGTINVTSTGTLSVLGYIIGTGPINVASSGSVYQLFTIMDYRSGGYTVSAAGDGYYLAPVTGETMVSPFLRYAFLNIQVPMQISSGGNLYGYCDMFTGEAMGGAAKAQHNVTNALIIGNTDGALINLSSGATAAIVYDSSVYSTAYSAIGRTTITISGGASVGAFSLKASVAGITKDVRSDSFTFPIPYNFEVRLTAKDANTPAVYTIAKPLAFLPGATLYVGENAQLQLNGSNIVALYDGLYDHTSTGSSMAYGTVGINHYPYTSQLNKAAFNQGTAALVVDGSLMIGANVQFGGTVQTNGTGTVSVDSSASTQCTVQIGLVGRNYIGIDILNIGNEYLYAGATVRTLTAQLMNSDGVLFPMQQGETYFGVDNCAHTLDTYEYTLYTSYDKAEGTVLSISGENAEVLNARIVGSWCTVPGHDYQLNESQSSAPTCTEHGKNVYVCSACGNSYFESLDPAHTWDEDGNCKVCGVSQSSLIDLYGTSVRAGDSLGMYFYVKKEDLPNANGSKTTSGTYYAKVIHAKADGTTETVTDIEGELYQDAYYRFYFTGVAAKEMADMVYVSIYDNNDTLVSNVYSESVENYAVSLLEAIGENPSGRNALLQQTLVDMLYYGAACQEAFTYNTGNLANAQIKGKYTPSNGEIDYGSAISNSETVKQYCTNQSVSVKESLVFSFFFEAIDASQKATITYTDHYGVEKKAEVSIVAEENGSYRVDVTGLAIADGYVDNAQISCTVKLPNNAGEITAIGRISNYASTAKDSAEVTDKEKAAIERLMYFAASAYEYLHEVIQSA